MSNTTTKHSTHIPFKKSIAQNIARTLLLSCLKKVCLLKRWLKKTTVVLTSAGGGKEPLYDILNCGPRHRFCTPWVIAHNCLGLGYGAGPVKFVDVARILADLDVMTLQTEEDKRTTFTDRKTGRPYTPAEIVAKRLVDQFRATNPEIAHVDYNRPQLSRGFWAKCENHMRAHIGKTCEYELPSGRIIRYFDVKDIGGLSCVTVDPQSKKLARRRTWGSHITENLTQGVARDVLAYHKLRVEDSGIPVLFSVHDELVTMVRDSEAQAAYDTINTIMSAPPPWMPGLPVAAEGKITKVYCK